MKKFVKVTVTYTSIEGQTFKIYGLPLKTRTFLRRNAPALINALGHIIIIKSLEQLVSLRANFKL